MQSILKDIKRPMQVGTEVYNNPADLFSALSNAFGYTVTIKLPAHTVSDTIVPDETTQHIPQTLENQAILVGHTYKIRVRQYMTKPGTPDFDFMTKWNKDIPMPFRMMVGKATKETRGMVFMELHAEAMETDTCMRCGRRLTHPVSKLYGVGPECGSHAYINPFDTEEELYKHLDEVKQSLRNITWSGWIVKTAIEESEEIAQ